MPRATTSRLFPTPELTLAPFPTAPPYDAAGDRGPVYHPGRRPVLTLARRLAYSATV
jgi:hypothetical protein